MNFEDDIKIDETALDVECLRQPTLMILYGKNVAEKEYILAKAKMNLEMVKAEWDQEIRVDPEKFGLTKITETTVAGALAIQPDCMEAEEQYLNAVYALKVARVAVDALSQKKDMLEALIKLYGQQYFAGPKVPRDLHNEWETKQNNTKSNQAVADKFIRRRK